MIVFTTIMDPGARLAEAACSEYNREATVNAVSPTFVQLTVSGFASRSAGDDGITMKIPALLFRNADKILNQYWFARLMNPDFSPHISRVTFPDGHGEHLPARQSSPPSRTPLPAPGTEHSRLPFFPSPGHTPLHAFLQKIYSGNDQLTTEILSTSIPKQLNTRITDYI